MRNGGTCVSFSAEGATLCEFFRNMGKMRKNDDKARMRAREANTLLLKNVEDVLDKRHVAFAKKQTTGA